MLRSLFPPYRGAVIVATLVLVGSIATVGVAGYVGAAAPPTLSELMDQAYQVDGHNYPAVVARVNNRPITGKELAQRMFIVQTSRDPRLDKTNVERTALDQLIEEAVLITMAPAHKITVTDDEAVAYGQSMQQLVARSKDPAQQGVFAVAASHLGVSEQQFARNPRAMETYRDALILSRMRQQISQALPAQQRSDATAINEAVHQFVAQSGAHVDVLVSR